MLYKCAIVCHQHGKKKEKQKCTGNFLPGYYPLSLWTFPFPKYNTMQCIIQNKGKTGVQINTYHHINIRPYFLGPDFS